MKYGYCRVSTFEQDLDVQLEWLNGKGVLIENVYSEKISGKSTENRKQLEKLIDVVGKDDVIYVYKLDRLARNTRDSLDIMSTVRKKHADIYFGDIGMIEDSQVGDLIFTIFAAIAEMERKRIVERTQSGRKYQKEHNPDFHEGRPKKLTENQLQQLVLRSKNESITELASSYNVSRATIYNYLNRYKDEDLKTS